MGHVALSLGDGLSARPIFRSVIGTESPTSESHREGEMLGFGGGPV